MRLSAAALIPALCLAISVPSPTATVLLYDPHSEARPTKTLAPVPARLVLAQRLGAEDYHSTDLDQDGVVEAINDYGVQTKLFAPILKEENVLKKAFLLLEGGREPHHSPAVAMHSTASFLVEPVPAMSGMFIDLARQSQPLEWAHLSDRELYLRLKEREATMDADIIQIVDSMANFAALYHKIVASGMFSVTAIVMSSGEVGIDSGSSIEWGTYEMPGSQSSLKKRQQKEEPLTETQDFEPVHSTSAPFTPLADTTPLRGILPSCFSSLASCERETRNCTGHGECKLKYHDNSAETNKACYSCSCPRPKNGDRTRWAGPACQKKDVSVEFWLIALFSVGMVFLVGFAIGQVWEMGEQDLPSVIGAGVSGPSARK